MAALVIFTRSPEPGKVKTRLIPALGPEGAANLHRRMTLHTLAVASRSRLRGRMAIRYTGEHDAVVRCFGAQYTYQPQGDGDLGQRMARAFADHFARREDRVVIVGTDCPGLTPALLHQACAALSRRDLVLGPARDGGYYLIGLRAPNGTVSALFAGIEWGTERVLTQNLAAAHRLGLAVHLLPQRRDVDVPDDLDVWRRHNEQLTVIVPTLNEESHLRPTLERIVSATDVEVIVADGGSTDRTVALAESMGVRVIVAPRGRARQMNAAVAASTGGRLLFCHADTLLPPGYNRLVLDTLADPAVALGAFTFRLAGHQTALRRIEAGANFRSRRLKLPYGDQALFIRRETFERLAGFFNLPVMEDFDLVRRAARLGRIVTLDAPAITSPRKWLEEGTLRTILRHQGLIARYYLTL